MRTIQIALTIAAVSAFCQADDLATSTAATNGTIRAYSAAGAYSTDLREANARKFTRAWERSLIPLFASQSLDAASSYGYRELNPMLADANGKFGMKATSVKFSVVAGLVGVEYLLVRKSPKAARLFEKLNWSSSALTSGLAVRNFVVR